MEKLKELVKSVLPNSHEKEGVERILAIDDVIEFEGGLKADVEWQFVVQDGYLLITLSGEDFAEEYYPMNDENEPFIVVDDPCSHAKVKIPCMIDTNVAHCIEAINKKEYHFYECDY